MLIYYKQVLARAVAETLRVFGWERAGPVGTKIYISIGAILLLAILGFLGMAFDQLIVGTVVVVVSIAAYPIVLLWKLFVAPYLIYQELRAELEALRVPQRNFAWTVAEPLNELVSEGNQLIDRQAHLSMGQSYKDWVADLTSWCSRAEEIISNNLPRDEALGFSSISSFPNEGHTGSQLKQIVRSRHGKLRLIAMRYMENSP